MVRDFDHLCPDLLAHVGNIWDQPILLCDVGCVEPANLLPNTAHGDVCLLSKGRLEEPNRIDADLQRDHAILGNCDFLYGDDVSIPGACTMVPRLLVRKMGTISE